MKKVIFTPNAPNPIGPYSQAILSDKTLYVSGQIAIDPKTSELIIGNIADETHQVMRNIQSILSEAGFTFSHIVKTTILLTSISDFQEVNLVYGNYFMADFPARETYQVAALPKGANVEITVVACLS